MHLLTSLILEYLLILKTYLLSFGKTPPHNWTQGHKGDVILIQGFAESWYFLQHLGNYLNQKGYRIHTIPELNYNTQSTHQSVQIIEKYLDQRNLSQIILLSHSKGGVVAKSFLDTSDKSATVHRSFSIASPYQGTIWGYFHLFSLHETIPGSKHVRQILHNTDHLHKIINIYPKWDNHVIPQQNTVLPGAVNIEINIHGHTRVIHTRQTIEIIDQYLQSDSP